MPESGSKSFSLSTTELPSLFRGLLIATATVVLDYVALQIIPYLQENQILNGAVIVFIASLVNAAQKWVRDTRDRADPPSVAVRNGSGMYGLLLLPLLWLIPSSSATAAEAVLLITPSGYYLLDVDSSGKPSLSPITRVIDLTGGTPLPPPTDPDPVPAPTLRSKSRDLARQSAVDPLSAKAISEVYSAVSSRVASGEMEAGRSFEAISAATNLVLTTLGTTSEWQAWRSGVSAELVDLQKFGKLSTKEQYVDALNQIQGGLDDYLAGSGLLDNINWQQLFELIKLILALLASFK